MKSSIALLIGALALQSLFGFHATHAASAKSTDKATLDALARRAMSEVAAQRADAIAKLRAAGPAGLDAMFDVYGSRTQPSSASRTKDAHWEELRAAIDIIGQQRDCYASHLYWYTDLEAAEAAARVSGKPILSLRLLGKLNEEYSCANSRFFRTTLYPNAQVSAYLREHFILHWQSVRPVPRITIDMGDGRRIERTITGNSIHYVLDAEGNPIDALPGLYGAKAFLAELDRAVAAEEQASKLNGAARETFLSNYHSSRLASIEHEWASDLAIATPATAAPFPGPFTTPSIISSMAALGRRPDAIAAAPIAASKSAIEAPMLRGGAENALAWERDRLDAKSTAFVWQRIAALHSDEATLDSATVRLIQYKQPPTAAEAMLLTFSKTRIESPMVRMLRNLQRSIAEDTVRNEYQLHAEIHEWFAEGTAPANLDALNSKIYAELFLTPNSDAWLGLAPNDVFSALDGGGLVQNTTSGAK
jgi:hypothetical protein